MFFSIANAEQTETSDSFKYNGEKLIFEITKAGHITASFRATPNARNINLQVIRGEKNDLRADPDAPAYALDIRISDNEDASIASQTGTGSFVDKSWAKKTAKQPMSLKNRSADISGLILFANELEQQVKPLLSTSNLSEWTWIIDETVQLMKFTDKESKRKFVTTKQSRAATSTTYKRVVTIKKKPAFGVTWFDHSSISTSLYQTSTGKLLSTLVTCNHGTCASSSAMNTHCSKTFYQQYVDSYASDLLCDLYGYKYGQHVCNNDTRAEYLSIKNKSKGTWSSCSTPKLYAPSCD